MFPKTTRDVVLRRKDAVRKAKVVLEYLNGPSPSGLVLPARLDNEIKTLVACERLLDENSRSKFGSVLDSELQHSICVARKELENSLMYLNHSIESLKMLGR